MTDSFDVMERLLGKLRTDDPPVDPDVEAQVITELQTQDKAKVIAALGSALEDADAEYRCTVAAVFLAWDYTAALPHVKTLLNDENDGVRGFLGLELGAYKRCEAVPLLLEVLKSDPDGTHRVNAAWGLGNIGDPAALPALNLAMKDDDGVDHEGRPVKKIAAEAIRRITQEKATASVA